MTSIVDPSKKARKAAREAQKAQAQQRQKEALRLQEAESEVARRKASAANPTGRQSLLRTSPTGLKQTLGG